MTFENLEQANEYQEKAEKEIADLKCVNDSLEKTISELRERNITLKLKNIELENKIKKSFRNND